MRLLHTKSGEMKEFFEENIPSYAILSHRWLDDEVSLQDYEASRKIAGQGFEKIQRFCSLVASRGLEWGWVDTCCIDKTSSAELSEAINSMYRWYQNAEECYAYLSDVDWFKSDNEQEEQRGRAEFRKSKWFTRGWTLQELLAPRQVRFYDKSWEFIGIKNYSTGSGAKWFTMEISDITEIDAQYLRDSWRACAAVKMSWMARRETTRREDLTYALMGFFQVNMPLLYGEGGHRAFERLQLEIIQRTDDDSIFAHSLPHSHGLVQQTERPGILADGPCNFLDSGNVRVRAVMIEQQLFEEQSRPPYSVTNRGLAVHLAKRDVSSFLDNYPKEELEYQLDCRIMDHVDGQWGGFVIRLFYSTTHRAFVVNSKQIRPIQGLQGGSGDIDTQCIYIQL